MEHLSLVLALALAGLLAAPQLLATGNYYSTTIRARQSAQDKMQRGNVSLLACCRKLLWPQAVSRIDGLHPPEVQPSPGLPALVFACAAPFSFWHVSLLVSLLLSGGRYLPLFRWTHWLHLRIPARYTYLTGCSLAFLSIEGLASLSRSLPPSTMACLVLLQGWYLLTIHARLLPALPWVQRWERPSRTLHHPLIRWLGAAPSFRVSGLPYPYRAGSLIHLLTLGYAGGAQPQWMADFRHDDNPSGTGASDWFQLREDSDDLDWYGVGYAYSFRPLHRLPSGRWLRTPMAHLYRNHYVQSVRSWQEVQGRG